MTAINFKQLKFSFFFAAYYFFCPFVLVNCGSADTPYDKLNGISAEVDANDLCFTDEFLTADCQKFFEDNPDAVAPVDEEETEADTTI